jgi:cysteine-rich repeat protein
MGSSAARRLRLVCVVAALCAPAAARAARLFVPLTGLPPSARGVGRSQALELDPTTLAAVRAATDATLTAFPLGADGTATVILQRFEPFTARATAVLIDATGSRPLALPDRRYFRGRVDGDPTSLVLLVAGPDTARGFVATANGVYRFGRDRDGVHRSWALRDADPAQFPGPGSICANDAHRDALAHGGSTAVAPGTSALPPPTGGFSPPLLAEVAIDTDTEFLAKFATVDDAVDYLSDLAASVSAIYDADTNVRVKFSYVRLWLGSDPWTATTTANMLDQLKGWWQANETGTPRDTTHFVSGKTVTGGIAYIDTLCDPDFGYGVSTVYGSFDLMNPDDIWDVMVVAHELGHNFGSEHTHCYAPPLDHCYNGESGCWNGAESLPPGGGTIMSYCHLLPGGLSNVNLTFGTTVSQVLRTGAENGVCIGPPCGDGLLDPEEECDDGNNLNGDCCSASCTMEPDGGSCDDGEGCTSSDQCSSGACAGTPVTNGTPCDDGSLCTVDGCQNGACVGVPTPAVVCKAPTLPLKSQLTMKNKSPDKADQVAWKWTKGAATTLGDFGLPYLSDSYELCVYDATPSVLFHGHFPAGGTCHGVACWKTLPGKGYLYKDKDRTPDGMEKLQLIAGAAGAAKISVKGKADNLDMPTLGAPALPVTVQLRGAGQCWGATFSTPLTSTSEQLKAKSD